MDEEIGCSELIRNHFILNNEVSLTQGLLGIFLVGMVLCNRAVELNVAMFSELSLAVAGR